MRIKFPLKMPDGEDVRSLEELREHFDVEAILEYFASGRLVAWLENHMYGEEAEKIKSLNLDSDGVIRSICNILEVSSKPDYEETFLAWKARHSKMEIVKRYTTEAKILDNIDYIAFSQDEFDAQYERGTKTILFCFENLKCPVVTRNLTTIDIVNGCKRSEIKPPIMIYHYDWESCILSGYNLQTEQKLEIIHHDICGYAIAPNNIVFFAAREDQPEDATKHGHCVYDVFQASRSGDDVKRITSFSINTICKKNSARMYASDTSIFIYVQSGVLCDQVHVLNIGYDGYFNSVVQSDFVGFRMGDCFTAFSNDCLYIKAKDEEEVIWCLKHKGKKAVSIPSAIGLQPIKNAFASLRTIGTGNSNLIMVSNFIYDYRNHPFLLTHNATDDSWDVTYDFAKALVTDESDSHSALSAWLTLAPNSPRIRKENEKDTPFVRQASETLQIRRVSQYGNFIFVSCDNIKDSFYTLYAIDVNANIIYSLTKFSCDEESIPEVLWSQNGWVYLSNGTIIDIKTGKKSKAFDYEKNLNCNPHYVL